MARQMTIFDFIKPDYTGIAIDDLDEKEMVTIIGNALDLDFKYDSFFETYMAKVGDECFRLGYSNYTLSDRHDLFISCGWDKKTHGKGRPCDSLDEAIKWFKAIRRS